jgi:hypothetical protein
MYINTTVQTSILIHGEYAQGEASWVGFPHNKMGLLWQRKILQI